MIEFAAAVVSHPADPNILVPSIVAAIPTTIAAATGLYFAMRSNRKNRAVTEQNRAATEDMHADIRTNHGKRPGEYLEMIEPLSEWAKVHTDEDNEIRAALGLAPATPLKGKQ